MAHDDEPLQRKAKELLDRFSLARPDIASRADDKAFLLGDLAADFADEARAYWMIEYAMQIVNAELRGGEAPPDQEMYDIDEDELWGLYERRDMIESPRVRRAIEVLDYAGFILPPDLREDEE